MPYKDPEKQKAAKRRSYARNKAAIMERQQERRQRPGYRDREMAARMGLSVEEYRARKAAGTLRPRAARPSVPRKPRRTPREPGSRVQQVQARRRGERPVSAEQQALIDRQRELKASALRRLGLDG